MVHRSKKKTDLDFSINSIYFARFFGGCSGLRRPRCTAANRAAARHRVTNKFGDRLTTKLGRHFIFSSVFDLRNSTSLPVATTSSHLAATAIFLDLRSVNDSGTCKENAAAQCRLATNFAAKHVFQIGSRHCAAAFSLQTPKSCTDLHTTLLHKFMLRSHTKSG